MTVTLRPERDEDRPLLEELFADSRSAELAHLPGPARAEFVRLQVTVRESGWRSERPAAEHLVVELGGRPVGRLLVDRSPEVVHVVDVALLPDCRGRGIGTELLRPVLADADATGRRCELTVDHGNPAGRLYERLGFVEVARDPVRARLRRPAVTRQPKAAS